MDWHGAASGAPETVRHEKQPRRLQVAVLRQQLAAAKAEAAALRRVLQEQDGGGANVDASAGGSAATAGALEEAQMRASTAELELARTRIQLVGRLYYLFVERLSLQPGDVRKSHKDCLRPLPNEQPGCGCDAWKPD